MKKYIETTAIKALILASAVALTVGVVTTLTGLGAGLPGLMDLDPTRVALFGLAWIAMLVVWSFVATVIAGALYNAAQEADSTARRFEARASLRRRYSAGELDAQEYDPSDLDRAA